MMSSGLINGIAVSVKSANAKESLTSKNNLHNQNRQKKPQHKWVFAHGVEAG